MQLFGIQLVMIPYSVFHFNSIAFSVSRSTVGSVSLIAILSFAYNNLLFKIFYAVHKMPTEQTAAMTAFVGSKP